MLQLSSIYYNRKVLSLRTGGPVGQATSPLINPNNLKIEGWYAAARGNKEVVIVPLSEVRDIIVKGIVVDDHTALTPADDLIRLKEIIRINYEIIGKSVVTEQKKKIGKVQDYAVDTDSMFIKKLYVSQSLLKNFAKQQLIIDRTQIVELNDKFIMVRDTTQKIGAPVRQSAPQLA